MAWQSAIVGVATQALLDEDSVLFIHQALSTPCLNAIVGAEGSWLTDQEGRRILDFHGNAVHQLGHGHPRVVAAIKEQLERLPFCPRRYTNQPAIDLARKLDEITPEPLGKTLFAPSGAAAVGMALKLARYATGRHKTLSMWDAFHGANLDTISVGGEAIVRRDVGPLLPGAEHVPPPGMADRFFGNDGHALERLASYIDYILDVQGDVACIIAEPMRWTTVDPPDPEFWQRIRRSCDRHQTLLIFDEIPSALGRTGSMFVFEQIGVVPDMVVLGKGLGGGVMPMAAIVARKNLDLVKDGALGHYTHEKSPLGAAAALAAIAVVEEERLCERARTLGGKTLNDLRSRLQDNPKVKEIRGLGLYLGVETTEPQWAEQSLYRCLTDGLSFKVGGGDVITLCPPLTIEEKDLDLALDILVRSLQS